MLEPARYRRQDGAVFLFAFDLLELNGQGPVAPKPLEARKLELGKLLHWAAQIPGHLEPHRRQHKLL